MRIINENNLKVLYADDGNVLKSKEDNYEKEYVNEKGIIIKEHIPYYFTKAYIPLTITIKDAKELYDELLESEKIKPTN